MDGEDDDGGSFKSGSDDNDGRFRSGGSDDADGRFGSDVRLDGCSGSCDKGGAVKEMVNGRGGGDGGSFKEGSVDVADGKGGDDSFADECLRFRSTGLGG